MSKSQILHMDMQNMHTVNKKMLQIGFLLPVIITDSAASCQWLSQNYEALVTDMKSLF